MKLIVIDSKTVNTLEENKACEYIEQVIDSELITKLNAEVIKFLDTHFKVGTYEKEIEGKTDLTYPSLLFGITIDVKINVEDKREHYKKMYSYKDTEINFDDICSDDIQF